MEVVIYVYTMLYLHYVRGEVPYYAFCYDILMSVC